MANWGDLRSAITSVIKTNGNEEITGAVMQNVLLTIVNSLGKYATFAGVATPTTIPGTPDNLVFYIAGEPGNYVNFGGISLEKYDVTIIYNDSSNSWHGTSLHLGNRFSPLEVQVSFSDGDNLVQYAKSGYYSSTNGQFVKSSNARAILIPFVNSSFRLYLKNLTSFNASGFVVTIRPFDLIGITSAISIDDLVSDGDNNYHTDVQITEPCSVVISYGAENTDALEIRQYGFSSGMEDDLKSLSLGIGHNLADYIESGYYNTAGQHIASANDRVIAILKITLPARIIFKGITSFNATGNIVNVRNADDFSIIRNVTKGEMVMTDTNAGYCDLWESGTYGITISLGADNGSDLEIYYNTLELDALHIAALQKRSAIEYVLGESGNFADTSKWKTEESTFAVDATNGIASINGGTGYNPKIYNTTTGVNGHRYYIRCKVRVNNSNCTGVDVGFQGGAYVSVETPALNTWIELAGIVTPTVDNAKFYIIHRYSTNSNSGNRLDVDMALGVIVIDLTDLAYLVTDTEYETAFASIAEYSQGVKDYEINSLILNDLRKRFASDIIIQSDGSNIASENSCSVEPYGTNGIKVTITSDITAYTNIFKISDVGQVTLGDILYVSANVVSSDVSAGFYGALGTYSMPFFVKNGQVNERYSILFQTKGDYNSITNIMRTYADYAQLTSGATFTLDNIVRLNLTKIFGKGNEPSKEIMDDFINNAFASSYLANVIDLLNARLSINEANINSLQDNNDLLLDNARLLTQDEKAALMSDAFTPPTMYAKLYGNYPNPALLNGAEVTSDTWATKKSEITARWKLILGTLPDLISPTLTMGTETDMGEYIQHQITLNWIGSYTTTGYLLVPKDIIQEGKQIGTGKRPGIVSVFYEPETGAGLGDKYGADHYNYFALEAVKRGYVALSIGEANGNEAFYYPNAESPNVQPLAIMAYCANAAYNALVNTGLVDASKIGIIGQSYGSKWAMFASCLYENFACGVWSDGGISIKDSNTNYDAEYYLGKKTTDMPDGAYQYIINNSLDFTELIALMYPRPFLVLGGAYDRESAWTELNYIRDLYSVMGQSDKVAMVNRGQHPVTRRALTQAFWFFDMFLK